MIIIYFTDLLHRSQVIDHVQFQQLCCAVLKTLIFDTVEGWSQVGLWQIMKDSVNKFFSQLSILFYHYTK